MRKLIYLFISLVLLSGNLYSQVTGGLISIYNSTGNYDDISRFIKSDVAGNMFVAGNTVISESNRDYLLIKYDAQGRQLWSRNYDGLFHGNDTVRSLFVDPLGNAYITGCSQGQKGVYDAVTVKYDPAGNIVWANRNKNDLYSSSMGYEVTVDNELNSYVAGWCEENGSRDCMLLKYSPQGDLVYKVKAKGSSMGYDEATCLALSNDMKYVYLGAIIDEQEGRYNFGVFKYDIQGNFIWKTSYDGTGNGNDFLTSMGVDKNGFIYVCGNSPGINTGNDIVSLKLNPSGEILWVNRYNGPSNGADWTCCLKLDRENSVYLAGGYLDFHNNACVIKYSSDGQFKWIATYNGQNNWHDCCQGVDFDEDLNVYMSGRTCKDGTTESDDIFTIKADRNGAKIWTKIYDGPDQNADYSSNLIYNKVSKKVFTLGHSYSNSTKYDVILLNYKNMNKHVVPDGLTVKISKEDFKTQLTNYPNPFNPSTKIQFTISKDDFIKLNVYDLSGRLIKNLVDSYQTAGNHQITFDGSGLSSGIYFYTLQTSSEKITNKLILNK